jgi:hypothetical protein
MEFGNLMSYGPVLDELSGSARNVSIRSLEVPTFRPSGGVRDKISAHFNHKTAMALDLTIHNH